MERRTEIIFDIVTILVALALVFVLGELFFDYIPQTINETFYSQIAERSWRE